MVQRFLYSLFYFSGLVLIIINQWMFAEFTSGWFTAVTSIFYAWYCVISFNDATTSLSYCSKATLSMKLYSAFLITYAASSYLLLILYIIDPDSAWFLSYGMTAFNSCTYYGREIFERLQDRKSVV